MFNKQFYAIIVATVLLHSMGVSANEITSSSTATSSSVDVKIEANQARIWLTQESYLLATDAYLWGSTLVRMEQVARQYTDLSQAQNDTSYRAPLNHFGHARRLPTDADTDMPTANRDTLYSSAIVDVSQEPMILSTPQVDDRYFVINMFDMWHNLFKYVGTRTTGSAAQKIMIAPPHWQGEVPKGVTLVEAPTTKVWLWGRTQVLGEQDYPQVHRIQDSYTLIPLSLYLAGNTTDFSAIEFSSTPLSPRVGRAEDPLRFYVEFSVGYKIDKSNVIIFTGSTN